MPGRLLQESPPPGGKKTHMDRPTLRDLERLAEKYGFVPPSVLEAWRQSSPSDAERDAAQVAILRGCLAYATESVAKHMLAVRK